jgi:hypothetical protein
LCSRRGNCGTVCFGGDLGLAPRAPSSFLLDRDSQSLITHPFLSRHESCCISSNRHSHRLGERHRQTETKGEKQREGGRRQRIESASKIQIQRDGKTATSTGRARDQRRWKDDKRISEVEKGEPTFSQTQRDFREAPIQSRSAEEEARVA